MSISLAKVDSFESNDDNEKTVKVLQFGAKTALQAGPFGDDSGPLKNMTAIYADTGTNGEPVILGYINNQQMAEIGEKRIYSLKPDGSLSFDIWLKNDETCEIGGNTDNLVRYLQLNASWNQLVAQTNVELGKIATAIAGVGGAYTVQPLNVNINSAKINEVKCSS